MKVQWQVILGIILAIIIAVFAVINTEAVEVNFLFTQTHWPLILIILGSVLVGCIIMFCLNVAKVHEFNKNIKTLHQEKSELERQLAATKALQTTSATTDLKETIVIDQQESNSTTQK